SWAVMTHGGTTWMRLSTTRGGRRGAGRGWPARRPVPARGPAVPGPRRPRPTSLPPRRADRGRAGASERPRRRRRRRGHVLPPIRTFTVGPGVPPGPPHTVRCAGRGLSPPARSFTDPGARVARRTVAQVIGSVSNRRPWAET